MPELVMQTPPTGLIGTTNYRVVRRQRAYASPSLRAVGHLRVGVQRPGRPPHLPVLARSGSRAWASWRGLGDNLVVAPYATGAGGDDRSCELPLDNFARLDALGVRGDHGFYEAVDFTPQRLLDEQGLAVVQCFMAHHQGMTVLGLHNALLGRLMRRPVPPGCPDPGRRAVAAGAGTSRGAGRQAAAGAHGPPRRPAHPPCPTAASCRGSPRSRPDSTRCPAVGCRSP